MVDFKKRLGGKEAKKPTDPIELYETLDRAVDKGPLRPAQITVLEKWFKDHRDNRDIIVKLHTGQGKTLIGLLMLQSKLNESKGPAVYICPDNFLIAQTCEQAKQFGIATCVADPDLPDAFLNGKTILVTSVQKLFNGLTKFGLNRSSINVGAFLMDDAHACADRIREACHIRIPSDEPAYEALKSLFSSEIEQQGLGTFADLNNGSRNAVLPIPYWSWLAHQSEVAAILSDGSSRPSVRYAWPLLKDMLNQCQCVISGVAVEIEPNVAPLIAFGSYWKAPHRIFMSATVTDDAFLVKGLQLNPKTILAPLTDPSERWSGEKMVLLPSLIDESLDRGFVVKTYGTPFSKRTSGVVALTPSFSRTEDWEAYGALVAKSDTLSALIGRLRAGQFDKAIVLANRYDGIDLPDDTCRILVFDSKPYFENLLDVYQEACRPNSEAILMRTIRTIEQGMGRSVRGEKDYSVIVIIGPDLVRLVRDKDARKFLSPQTATQIEIGLELADFAIQEMEEGEEPLTAFTKLIRQCLGRDEDWKAYYSEQMEKVRPAKPNERMLKIYESELGAESLYIASDFSGAAKEIQKLLDSGLVHAEDKGWYIQEMARYHYRADRSESQRLQIAAHNNNRLLLKPTSGVAITKLKIVSQGRVERIAAWIGQFDDFSQLDATLTDILGRLVFTTKADKFEHALDELARALGFAGERPDKEWKEGPDNLWAMDVTDYILWECKSEVNVNRAEINKRETEQMNRSSAWFEKHYPGAKVRRIIIHPGSAVASAASFTHEVEVMRESELKRLVKSVRNFFNSFSSQNFKDLSTSHIQDLLNAHELNAEQLREKYSRKPKNLK